MERGPKCVRQLPWWFLGTPQDLKEVSKPPETPEQNRTVASSPSRVSLALKDLAALELGSRRGPRWGWVGVVLPSLFL